MNFFFPFLEIESMIILESRVVGKKKKRIMRGAGFNGRGVLCRYVPFTFLRTALSLYYDHLPGYSDTRRINEVITIIAYGPEIRIDLLYK